MSRRKASQTKLALRGNGFERTFGGRWKGLKRLERLPTTIFFFWIYSKAPKSAYVSVPCSVAEYEKCRVPETLGVEAAGLSGYQLVSLGKNVKLRLRSFQPFRSQPEDLSCNNERNGFQLIKSACKIDNRTSTIRCFAILLGTHD